MRDHVPHFIKAGWLIDGSGGPAEKNILLTVNNGILTAVDRFEKSCLPDPSAVTDLSSCTILPPLVDCHVHLCMSGCTDMQARKQQLSADYNTIYSRITEHLHHHFIHGVLAVRDGGDHSGHTLRYKREPDAGNKKPVSIKAAGKAWHKKGRYGAVIGRHPQENETLAEAIFSEHNPIDHVKLINSGLNSLLSFGRETAPQFTLDELKETVCQAHQQGKRVMVHANGELPVRLALEAGCDSIEHGFFMGRDNLGIMADRQITWVPTAYTMQALAENMEPDDPRTDSDVVEKNLQHQLEQIALAKQYGVKIALGTDAGSKGILHGESLTEELKLIMEAGYSLTEAIQCATAHGAQLLGLDNIGRIATGKPAHFLVTRATPAMLPQKLSRLEGIYMDGVPCKRNSL